MARSEKYKNIADLNMFSYIIQGPALSSVGPFFTSIQQGTASPAKKLSNFQRNPREWR